jgi:hypothetical protein
MYLESFPYVLAFQLGSTRSLIAFVTICIGIVVSFLAAAGWTSDSRLYPTRQLVYLVLAMAAYCILIAMVVFSGVIERAFIPFGPAFFVTSITVPILVGLSKLGGRIAAGTPLALLVGFQGFRLPLEMVLHDWYTTGVIPESMTWTGSNWDIASGILAIVACGAVNRRRWLAWLVNIVGIVLLVNVARVAILSSPVSFGWEIEPKLELIAHLPYAYIVPICVGGAALGHVLLTRRLLRDAQATSFST